VVGNLARRGLVRRTRRLDDRRFITVTLTDKGRRLIGGIFPRHAQHVAREMRALSLADQAELGRLCRQLGLGRRAGREKETGNGATAHPLRLAPAL
jgi:MarR family 2-MHQ and catechol resistance regulon transcriptional repressor